MTNDLNEVLKVVGTKLGEQGSSLCV
jgi:hypothetical protein